MSSPSRHPARQVVGRLAAVVTTVILLTPAVVPADALTSSGDGTALPELAGSEPSPSPPSVETEPPEAGVGHRFLEAARSIPGDVAEVVHRGRGVTTHADPADPDVLVPSEAASVAASDAALQNLRTAERLLAADDPVEQAKIGTRHQVATLGLAWDDGIDVPSHETPSAALEELADRHGAEATPEAEEALAELDAMEAPLPSALADVVDAFLAFETATKDAYATADAEKLRLLLDTVNRTRDATDRTTRFTEDQLAQLRADGLDPTKEENLLFQAGVDKQGFARIFAARNRLLDEVEALRDALRQSDPTVPESQAADGCSGSGLLAVYCIDLESYDNTYTQDYLLQLDAGGRDAYENDAGGSPGGIGGAAALIDLGGDDDVYVDPRDGKGAGANGGGFNGAGFLFDAGGSDTYDTAVDFGGSRGVNGGAYGGAGFLYDENGTDAYVAVSRGANGGGYAGAGFLHDGSASDDYAGGGEGTNGGGWLGSGFLYDGSGEDTYTAYSRGTNGGGDRGSGFLLDRSGDDTYTAGSDGTNGGGDTAGFLYDGSGTDTYTAGYGETNGGGYGLLYDAEGTGDTYEDGHDPSNGIDETFAPKPEAGVPGAQIDAPQELCLDHTAHPNGSVSFTIGAKVTVAGTTYGGCADGTTPGFPHEVGPVPDIGNPTHPHAPRIAPTDDDGDGSAGSYAIEMATYRINDPRAQPTDPIDRVGPADPETVPGEDPDDSDPTNPVPAVEGPYADVSPGGCGGLDTVHVEQLGAALVYRGDRYGAVVEDACVDAGQLPLTVSPVPCGVRTGPDADEDGLPAAVIVEACEVTVTAGGGVEGPTSDGVLLRIPVDPDDGQPPPDPQDSPEEIVNQTLETVQDLLRLPTGDVNDHQRFLPSDAAFPAATPDQDDPPLLPPVEPGPVRVLGSDGKIVGAVGASVGPGDAAEAARHVLVDDGDGLEPAAADDLSVSAARIRVAAEPAPDRVLVERAYLEAVYDGIASPAPFDVVQVEDRSWVAFDDPDVTSGSAPMVRPRIGAPDTYTLGRDATVRLTDHAMRIEVEETPHTETVTETIETPNGTVTRERQVRHHRLVVDYTGADTTGQTVRYNRSWLMGMGIENPVFVHEDGSRLDFAITRTHYVVDVPHFSDVETYDDRSDGITKETDREYSEVDWWEYFPGDSWTSDDAVGVESDRRDDLDEIASEPTGTLTEDDSFHLQAHWEMTEQGNWQFAFPVFLAPSSATWFVQDCPSIYVEYRSRDSLEGQLPKYILRYEDDDCNKRISEPWQPSSPTGTMTFDIRYDGATRQLEMAILQDGSTVASASHVLGGGEQLTLEKLGTASDGRGSTVEPTAVGHLDDIEFHSDNHPDAYLDVTPSSAKVGEDFTMDASASSDDHTATSNLEAKWDFDGDTSWDTQWTSDLTRTWTYYDSGDHTVRVKIRDGEGLTDIASETITVTEEPPTACVEMTNTPDSDTNARLDATCSSDDVSSDSELQARWDWTGDGWDTSFEPDLVRWKSYPSGTHTAHVEIMDQAGYTDTDSVTFTVNDRPSACFDRSPSTVDPGEPVSLDASCSSDPETATSNLEVRWDFEADGSWDSSWTTDKTTSHSYQESGEQTIKLKVRDPDGRVDTTTRTVVVTEPPVACFTVDPSGGNTETLFTFDASCSSDDRTADDDLEVRWDWTGDDSWDTGWTTDKNTTHTYGFADVHGARVQVLDGDGLTDTATVQVSVSDANTDIELTGASLSPSNGTSDTRYTFSVVYADADNNPPDLIEVHVDGTPHPMEAFDPDDLDVRDGNLYTATLRFDGGHHTWAIKADDGYSVQTTPPRSGPLVEPYARLVDDGEDHLADWTATGLWHRSSTDDVDHANQDEHANPFSGSTSWWFGDDGSGTYEDGVPGGTLTSDVVDLTEAKGPIRLSFLSWYNTTTPDETVDPKKVQVKPTANATWETVETIGGIRDRDQWYPRTADLTPYVGERIQLRFSFQPDGINDTRAGWYVDDVAIGKDADRDGLTDHLEDAVDAGMRVWNAERRRIRDGQTTSVELRGLDAFNVDTAAAAVRLDHADWSQLDVTLENRQGLSCTIWNRTGGSGTGQIRVALADECDTFETTMLRTHQPYWANVSVADGGQNGWVTGFAVGTTSDLDPFESDGDGDTRPDGAEIDGSIPPGNTTLLDDVVDAPRFRSGVLSRDIDDDNRMDGYDLSPWVENNYPVVRDLKGLGGDIRDGTRFRLTDNHGIDRDSVLVKVYDGDGNVQTVDGDDLTYNEADDRWTARFPEDVDVYAINVSVTDVNGNRMDVRVDLVVDGGDVQNEISEMEVSAGYVDEDGTYHVQFLPVVLGAPLVAETIVVIAVLATVAIAWGLSVYDTYVEARTDGPDGEGRVKESPEVQDISTLLGTVTINGDDQDEGDRDFELYQGDGMFGWGRIHEEHGDRWDSAQAFLDDLKNTADDVKTWEAVDRSLTSIVAEIDGDIVIVSAFAGVISDVDVWKPGPWQAPGPIYMQHLLWMHAQIMEDIEGPDWIEEQPPFPVIRAPENAERDEPRELRRFVVESESGKSAGGERVPEVQLPVPQVAVDSIELYQDHDQFVAADVTESTISWASLVMVKNQAFDDAEATKADWYWGPVLGEDPCDEPAEQDDRRCDELPGNSGGPADAAPHDGKKMYHVWQTSGFQDALSTTGSFTSNPGLGTDTWQAPGTLLCRAEQGFDDVPGSYDATLPIALQSQPGSDAVYLELAASSADFQHEGEC